MSRSLVIVAVVIVVLLGLLVLLSTRSSERPLTRVEKVVTLENLQK